jgi:hypothetical protein
MRWVVSFPIFVVSFVSFRCGGGRTYVFGLVAIEACVESGVLGFVGVRGLSVSDVALGSGVKSDYHDNEAIYPP